MATHKLRVISCIYKYIPAIQRVPSEPRPVELSDLRHYFSNQFSCKIFGSGTKSVAAFGTFLQIHLAIEHDRWKWVSHDHVTNISGKIVLQRIFCAICKDIFLRIILLHVDHL